VSRGWTSSRTRESLLTGTANVDRSLPSADTERSTDRIQHHDQVGSAYRGLSDPPVSVHDAQVSDADDRRPRDDFDADLAETKSHERDFIGLTESEASGLARRLGLELRVIRDDHTALHLDLRSRRITVDVRTGRVTRADAG
jgi:hypothetical protein